MRRHRAAPPPTPPSTPKLVLAAFHSPATIDFGEQHPEKEAVKTLVLSCPADAKRSATVEVVRTPTNVAAHFEGGAVEVMLIAHASGVVRCIHVEQLRALKSYVGEEIKIKVG